MFEVPYLASDLPSLAPFDMEGSLTVSMDDLLHAAITVGRWRKDVLRHGRYSVAVVCTPSHVFQGVLRH